MIATLVTIQVIYQDGGTMRKMNGSILPIRVILHIHVLMNINQVVPTDTRRTVEKIQPMLMIKTNGQHPSEVVSLPVPLRGRAISRNAGPSTKTG